MVFVHDMSSECALEMHEILLKYLEWLSRHDFVTDRLTNARGNNMSPTLPWGRHNN